MFETISFSSLQHVCASITAAKHLDMIVLRNITIQVGIYFLLLSIGHFKVVRFQVFVLCRRTPMNLALWEYIQLAPFCINKYDSDDNRNLLLLIIAFVTINACRFTFRIKSSFKLTVDNI